VLYPVVLTSCIGLPQRRHLLGDISVTVADKRPEGVVSNY